LLDGAAVFLAMGAAFLAAATFAGMAAFLAAGAGFLAGGITISWEKHSGQQPARVAPIRTTSVNVSCAQFKIAVVALANKLARIIWAMMARGEAYRRQPVAS